MQPVLLEETQGPNVEGSVSDQPYDPGGESGVRGDDIPRGQLR